MSVLACEDLWVTYANGARVNRALSFVLQPGERVAVIGESGCGKTTLVRALLRLLPLQAKLSGRALFAGQHDLASMPERQLCALRGAMIGYVPQNPLAAFDPLRSVGYQLTQAWRCHGRAIAPATLAGLIEAIGIDQAAARLRQRPAAWSGGMLQRALIVAATALAPPLVLADEPTSAVDRPLARQMLQLLAACSRTLLTVTHDIDLVDGLVDRVLVMYGGRLVEDAPLARLADRSGHPYTAALLAALPRPGRLPAELPGDPPSLLDDDPGCAFAPRCIRRAASCSLRPALRAGVACHQAHGTAS